MVDGTEARGLILAISPEGITLDPALTENGKHGKFPPWTIAAEKVLVLEHQKTHLVNTILVGAGAVGVVVGLGFAVNAFADSMDGIGSM